MKSIKQLSMNIRSLSDFEYMGNKYEMGKSYFIVSEYSDNDPTDVIKTSKWVVDMMKENKIEVLHPHTLLPESNMIDKELIPYMEDLINYIREYM